MIYVLPAPYHGATHLSFRPEHGGEITIGPDRYIRLTGTLGTMDGKQFVPCPHMRAVTRTIEHEEYSLGFRPHVQAKGAPRGNFRDVDIEHWLDKWGWASAEQWQTRPKLGSRDDELTPVGPV